MAASRHSTPGQHITSKNATTRARLASNRRKLPLPWPNRRLCAPMTRGERLQRAKKDWRRPKWEGSCPRSCRAAITVAVLVVGGFDFEAIETAVIGAIAGVVAFVLDLAVSFLWAWIKAPGKATSEKAAELQHV